MQFDRGQFRPFRATNKIHLGQYGLDIPLDSEFLFDGSVVRYRGKEYDVPQLRGVVGTWIVPAADTTTQYRSRPAGVQVRAATPEGENRGASFSMGQASEEEAVVGTMDNAQAIRKASHVDASQVAALRQNQRAAAQSRAAASWESNPEAPPPENASDVDPEAEAALMPTEQYTRAQPLLQPGTTVASPVEMEAVARANAINQEIIARKAAELEQADPRKTRDQMGGTRHDSLEGQTRVGGGKYGLIRDEQDDGVPVGNYRFSSGATVGAAEDTRRAAKATDVSRAPATIPIQVGEAVAHTPKRAIQGAQVIDDPMTLHEPQAARARGTTQVTRGGGNVGIDEIGPDGSTGDVFQAVSADALEDLVPGAAVAGRVGSEPQRRAPAPPPRISEADEIKEIVANWSIKRNWQKRVEEAVEFYGEWPEALEAIYAVESPAVVKQIQTKVAERSAG